MINGRMNGQNKGKGKNVRKKENKWKEQNCKKKDRIKVRLEKQRIRKKKK